MRPLAAVVLVGLLGISASRAQQPRFSQGFAGAGQNAPDPDEASAYAAATSEPDPEARIATIQQFLTAYPNSMLRQAAISQMTMARRQSRAIATPESAMPPRSAASPASSVAGAAVLPAPQTMRPLPDSLLQRTAKHAEVTVAPHSLTIKADNSELSQILHDISGSTGMKVEGLSKDERIFGDYGPGDAHQVLLSLLEGSGYNVLMVGETADGAPRELSLTQRSTGAAATPGAVAKNNGEDQDDADQDVQQTVEPEQPLPGNPQNPEAQPRQIQQELLRLRQQQQQQQQPQTPPQ